MMTFDERLRIATNDVPDERSIDLDDYIGHVPGEPLAGRHGTFNYSFHRGLIGESMGEEAIGHHRWSSDGYRLGLLFGAGISIAEESCQQRADHEKKLADATFCLLSTLAKSLIERVEAKH